jgi:uncharacterized membrane protein
MVARGFGFYSNVIIIMLLLTGMIIGINQSTASGSGLFGVILIQLLGFCESYQFFLKVIMFTESYLVSYERAVEVSNLETEKELRNTYDEEIGLSN